MFDKFAAFVRVQHVRPVGNDEYGVIVEGVLEAFLRRVHAPPRVLPEWGSPLGFALRVVRPRHG